MRNCGLKETFKFRKYIRTPTRGIEPTDRRTKDNSSDGGAAPAALYFVQQCLLKADDGVIININ
jgi:hypothetical protein